MEMICLFIIDLRKSDVYLGGYYSNYILSSFYGSVNDKLIRNSEDDAVRLFFYIQEIPRLAGGGWSLFCYCFCLCFCFRGPILTEDVLIVECYNGFFLDKVSVFIICKLGIGIAGKFNVHSAGNVNGSYQLSGAAFAGQPEYVISYYDVLCCSDRDAIVVIYVYELIADDLDIAAGKCIGRYYYAVFRATCAKTLDSDT